MRDTVIVPASRSIFVVSDRPPRIALISEAFDRIVDSLTIGKLTHSPVSRAFIAPKSLIFFVVVFILSFFIYNFMLQR